MATFWISLGATGAAIAASYAVRRATLRVRWYLMDRTDDITSAAQISLPILALCLWATALVYLVRSNTEAGHSTRLSAWMTAPVVAIIFEAATLRI